MLDMYPISFRDGEGEEFTKGFGKLKVVRNDKAVSMLHWCKSLLQSTWTVVLNWGFYGKSIDCF